jgi:NADPH:quinone reductase-like Zn-dependent oxidoreductase
MTTSPQQDSTTRMAGTATTPMKAVVQHGYGPPQRALGIARIDRPHVGSGDVLIRVRGTSVNTPDRIAVTGLPRILRLQMGLRGPGTPVRGSDVAGIVETVGADVAHLRPGDEVFGSLWDNQPLQPSGAFAEFTVVPADQVIRKPIRLSLVEAGASVMAALTALNAIRDVGDAGPHTRVLVNGASGGVGTMAVQIARTLGAEVTGVCSTRNVALVGSLGADHVIDYTSEDFTRSPERYDLILDNVMNHPPAVTAQLLTLTGVLIPNSAGTSAGTLGGMPRAVRAMLMSRRSPTRVRLATCEVTHQNLTALAGLLDSGAINVVIDNVYPLDQVAQAVAHLLGRHARGKVAISI